MDEQFKSNAVADTGMSSREAELIRLLVEERKAQNQTLEYEDFDGYEIPPRTQFSMLKKPAVSIKYGKLVFNMAAIRLFPGIQLILPMLHRSKKRLTVATCKEEEMDSVEWARLNRDEQLVNKDINTPDFTKSIFTTMGWNQECRYKVLGQVKNSERGLCLVFELKEAIMFSPQKEEYVDVKTGEIKKRQVKYQPEIYRDRCGKYYSDYVQSRQMSMFEDLNEYEKPTELPHPTDTTGQPGVV